MPKAIRTHIDPLDCIVVDGGPDPSIAVVICHGYGASYDDLAPLANEWIALMDDESSKKIRFIFPDAPHSLEDVGMPDARAWWPINMAGLAQAVQASRFDQLHKQEPPGIGPARKAVCEMIRNAKAELGGEQTPLVLGGFSQGAMLSTDVSIRGDVITPQVLLLFSGTLICEKVWKEVRQS